MATTSRSAEQLRAIIRTQTEIVSGELEPEAIMQLIAERAQELTDASAGRSVIEGRVLRSDDTADDDRVDAEACNRVHARSMICVPLSHHGETVGVLKVYAPEAHHFDGGDVETLELLSELIAAHLSHANLYEAESRESRHDALTGLLNRRAFEERLPVSSWPAPPATTAPSLSAVHNV